MDKQAPSEEQQESRRLKLAADLRPAWIKATGEERRGKKAQFQKWTVKKTPGKPQK